MSTKVAKSSNRMRSLIKDRSAFFFVANAHLRLHVHLEISPAYRDVFTIRVSPAYFFPATDHTRLAEIVNAWNLQNHEVTAIVHGSSDRKYRRPRARR